MPVKEIVSGLNCIAPNLYTLYIFYLKLFKNDNRGLKKKDKIIIWKKIKWPGNRVLNEKLTSNFKMSSGSDQEPSAYSFLTFIVFYIEAI